MSRSILGMPVVEASILLDIGVAIFEALGSPRFEAEIVSSSLVEADLAGVHSHGVMRIPYYVEHVREGLIKPGARIEVVRETPTTAIIDGGGGFGQVAARRASEVAVSKAEASGISAVAAVNTGHIGRLGEYTLYIAEKGMVGLGFCTTYRASVAPYGGRGRRLSTAPISVAAPSDRFPFLLDYATSIVAEGKLRLKYLSREPTPEAWVVDPQGRLSMDPSDFYDRGGALLPFGGYKGYALAMAVEILSGILVGAGFPCSGCYKGMNSLLLIALDPSAFVGRGEFRSGVSSFIEAMKSTPPAEGFVEVLVPGEPEYRSREEKLRLGIPVEDEVWARIRRAALELGLDFDSLSSR
ncbi:MAG: Ldh family oxidoreductase [Nitrososphaerota archaeon]|nr:Ldh family oxidoreductase [Candidatus Bathyarchaeota archaeon]MDW8061862.1 Ldh family oxidoreductase [Nitrososphaerota archaeon]